MCLNRARQRRRLRHLLEDWRNMYDHGLNADVSADLASWMTQHGWRWMPLDESGEDPQVRVFSMWGWGGVRCARLALDAAG